MQWRCHGESCDGGLDSTEAEGLVRLKDRLSFSGRFLWKKRSQKTPCRTTGAGCEDVRRSCRLGVLEVLHGSRAVSKVEYPNHFQALSPYVGRRDRHECVTSGMTGVGSRLRRMQSLSQEC